MELFKFLMIKFYWHQIPGILNEMDQNKHGI
jgi:hypothetical protein